VELQRCDVASGIVIDYVNAIPAGMRHENAAALGIECAMIERAACGSRYLNHAHCG
jgi:hypothetical protein